MSKISVGEATVKLLADYGIDTVFGIPGVHTLELYRGFGEGSPVRHIQARNELGAGFMADGYARATGKAGVCLTISGPGVTNAATALGQAYADSIPLLLISAEAATHTLGNGRGALHEVTDLNAVTRPLTAISTCVKSPEDLPGLVAEAFAIFASKRPRPVHIAIPTDILETLVDYDWKPVPPPTRPLPQIDRIEQAARMLNASQNSIIIVGGGAVEANITELAENTNSIVVSSNAGKGIIPDTHSLSLGGTICRTETQALIAEADLVIAIGTELSETDTYVDKLEFSAPMIRIDIDENQVGGHYPAKLEIVGDAKTAVDELIDRLETATSDRSEKETKVASIRSAIDNSLIGSEIKHSVLHKLIRETVPEETLIFSDATQMTYSGSFLMPVYRPRSWHYAAGYCALGFAFPNAIGAKIAMPDVPMVAIAGDGGTMFTVQEWITAAELRLPIPLILWHNDGYKQIRDDMRRTNVPRIAVDGLAPDFITLAKSMHCKAVAPGSPEELKTSISDAFAADRPTVIVVREDADWG